MAAIGKPGKRMYLKLGQFWVCAIFLLAMPAPSARSQQAETPPLEFVTLFVHQLANEEAVREKASTELKVDASNFMPTCIRNATAFHLTLHAQVGMLRRIRLRDPFGELPGNIAEFNQKKIELYQRMSHGCEAMLAGPKPGVDYGAIAAEAPKITATIEYIDKALFDATPMVFATLIDPVPDPKNQMSKLIISASERRKLIADIDNFFGKKFDLKEQNYTVGAASVLKAYLLKDYTTSDVPPKR
jgi:hypothetical protein